MDDIGCGCLMALLPNKIAWAVVIVLFAFVLFLLLWDPS